MGLNCTLGILLAQGIACRQCLWCSFDVSDDVSVATEGQL